MADPIDEAIAAGWQPLEPYPGATERFWLARCRGCGIPTEIRLHLRDPARPGHANQCDTGGLTSPVML